MQPYDQLGDADRRTMTGAALCAVGGYVAIFVVVLAVTALNPTVGGWVTAATKTDMTGSIGPSTNPKRLVRTATPLPIVAVEKPFSLAGSK